MDEITLAARRIDPGSLNFAEPDTWYKGEHCIRFPFNRPTEVEDILYGWKPPERLIHSDTKVMAFGSCFAEYFVRFLEQHNYNRWQVPDEQHANCDVNLLVSLAVFFENLFVIVQHMRWAFGEFTPESKLWFTKDKTHFEATEERRAKARRSFEDGDVFVITLGLSEVWFDQIAGEPMWRTIPSALYEPERHVCRRATVAETVAAFFELDRLVTAFMPGKRFIFTLSPIPLVATFRNQSSVTANQVSKAVLRAALDEFICNEEIAAKGRYYYFPSHELVLNLFEHPFQADNRHIRPEVASAVIGVFSALYTDIPCQEIRIGDRDSHIAELEARVRNQERQLREKEQVIRELDQAARERLALIERLTANPRQ